MHPSVHLRTIAKGRARVNVSDVLKVDLIENCPNEFLYLTVMKLAQFTALDEEIRNSPSGRHPSVLARASFLERRVEIPDNRIPKMHCGLGPLVSAWSYFSNLNVDERTFSFTSTVQERRPPDA